MAIISLANAGDPGAVLDEHWTERTRQPIWLTTTFVGCVVDEREANYHDDSDFYATVWDAARSEFREVMFATTRGWSYPCLGSGVDATPEVRALWDAYNLRAAAYRGYLLECEQRAREAAEAVTPRVGKLVRVVAGRKVPVGSDWWVVSEEAGYARGARRLGLRDDAGARAWTDARNVAVLAVYAAGAS